MTDWFRLLRDMVRLTVRAGRRPALMLALCTVAQAGVIAGIGLSQRKLVDDSAAGRGAGVVVAVLLGAAAYAVSATAGRVRGNLQVYLVGRVRGMQNERTQRLVSSIPTLAHLEHSPFINRWDRLFESSQALAAMPWSALNAVVAAAGLAVTVGLLVSVSPYLCLLALLGVPLYASARRADRLLREARDAATEALRLHHRLHDMCVEPESAKEVLLTGGAQRWSRRATDLWEAAAGGEAAARLRGAAWQAGAWVLYAAGFAAALVLVAQEIRSGRTGVGAVVLVVSLATQLQGQLRMVLESLTETAEAGQVVSHYWWLKRYAAAAERPGAPVPVVLRDGITLSGVGFRYPGAETDVLHDVDLHLPAGGTVAIIGANGAGKSTLIKLLTGMHEPSTGRITVDGMPLAGLSGIGWRARLSGVFQDFARLRLRVGETVGVGNVRFVRDRAA
ncbi:ATP-binding cassette domain-containing protein, partial [Couchioplanes caeruleus]